MDRTYTAARARAVAQAAGRHAGRPVARPASRIDYARLLKARGESLGVIAARPGVPKTSVHHHLTARVAAWLAAADR